MRKPLNVTPTTTATGAVVGRPRKQPSTDAAAQVEKLAAAGGSLKSIRHALGVSEDVFKRWLIERPELSEAFEKGREAERLALHKRLYDMAMKGAAVKGHMVAAMFLLKTRHGYREGEQAETGSRLNITLNMPAAKPLDQYIIDINGNDTRPAVQPLPNPGAGGR